MVEGARLESVYTLIAYRGFESLPLRQYARLYSLPLENRAAFNQSIRRQGLDDMIECCINGIGRDK